MRRVQVPHRVQVRHRHVQTRPLWILTRRRSLPTTKVNDRGPRSSTHRRWIRLAPLAASSTASTSWSRQTPGSGRCEEGARATANSATTPRLALVSHSQAHSVSGRFGEIVIVLSGDDERFAAKFPRRCALGSKASSGQVIEGMDGILVGPISIYLTPRGRWSSARRSKSKRRSRRCTN